MEGEPASGSWGRVSEKSCKGFFAWGRGKGAAVAAALERRIPPPTAGERRRRYETGCKLDLENLDATLSQRRGPAGVRLSSANQAQHGEVT